ADAPAWIDRIQPESIVEDRISDWGVYVEGWLNSWTSGNNVIKASQGTSLVYTADGHSAWYTGLQSKGSSDQGTMGFMLVDTRTGKASLSACRHHRGCCQGSHRRSGPGKGLHLYVAHPVPG